MAMAPLQLGAHSEKIRRARKTAAASHVRLRMGSRVGGTWPRRDETLADLLASPAPYGGSRCALRGQSATAPCALCCSVACRSKSSSRPAGWQPRVAVVQARVARRPCAVMLFSLFFLWVMVRAIGTPGCLVCLFFRVFLVWGHVHLLGSQ
jgi:hypothetical protein